MVKVSPRKDVPFKALLTYHMFKKTGVMPEGECFDAEYFQKAADEADFNEMADSFARKNRQKEIADTSPKSGSRTGTFDVDPYDIEYADLYADAMRGEVPTDADESAEYAAQRKKHADKRKELSNRAQPYGKRIANAVDGASATSVPEEEKGKYLFSQPEILGEQANKELGGDTYAIEFYDAIDGIVNSHLSDISDERRAAIAKELYDKYMDRFFDASHNRIYL